MCVKEVGTWLWHVSICTGLYWKRNAYFSKNFRSSFVDQLLIEEFLYSPTAIQGKWFSTTSFVSSDELLQSWDFFCIRSLLAFLLAVLMFCCSHLGFIISKRPVLANKSDNTPSINVPSSALESAYCLGTLSQPLLCCITKCIVSLKLFLPLTENCLLPFLGSVHPVSVCGSQVEEKKSSNTKILQYFRSTTPKT